VFGFSILCSMLYVCLISDTVMTTTSSLTTPSPNLPSSKASKCFVDTAEVPSSKIRPSVWIGKRRFWRKSVSRLAFTSLLEQDIMLGRLRNRLLKELNRFGNSKVLFFSLWGKTLIAYFSKTINTFWKSRIKVKIFKCKSNVIWLNPSFELKMDTMILRYLCEVKFIFFVLFHNREFREWTHYFFFQFQDILGLSVELMAQAMTSELLDGCQDDKSVKAGFVGEIGCCYPMNGL